MSREPYSSDLTDAQWQRIAPLPAQRAPAPAKPGGRHRSVDIRAILNAIFYRTKTGCQWRNLPHDLPPWSTAAGYYRIWRRSGVWETIHDALREQVRIKAGREPPPSAAIIDSQSVKTTEKRGVRGYDAGTYVNGRKRHLVVDTIGLVLAVVVGCPLGRTTSMQDRDGAKLVLARLAGRFPRLRLIWADGGYAGQLVGWVAERWDWTVAIVKRAAGEKGFAVWPRRWVVEPGALWAAFGWLGRYRVLSKDYEQLPESSETLVLIVMLQIMLKRLEPG